MTTQNPLRYAWAIAIPLVISMVAPLQAQTTRIYLSSIWVQRAYLDGTGLETLVSGVSYAHALAVDPVGERMYWIDNNRIQSANLDGSDVQDIVLGVTTSFEGLDVDPVGGKIYWPDADAIRRANLDGSDIETLVTTNAGLGLAVDPAGGKVYWGEGFRIQRANLDGSAVQTVVNLDEESALSMAVDHDGGKLYWVVSNYGILPATAIQRADLAGGPVETILRPINILVALDFDTDNRKIYYSMGGAAHNAQIARANPDGTGAEILIEGYNGFGLALGPSGPVGTPCACITGIRAACPAAGILAIVDTDGSCDLHRFTLLDDSVPAGEVIILPRRDRGFAVVPRSPGMHQVCVSKCPGVPCDSAYCR